MKTPCWNKLRSALFFAATVFSASLLSAAQPQQSTPAKETSAPKAPQPVPPVNPAMFKRFLAVDLSAQKVDLYEDGVITFSTPASSGREEKPTPNGVYKITHKHEKWTSTIYNVPMPHFLRLNGSEMGLHAGVLPGYPGSAGCIRLPEESARFLFSKLPVGTPVLIQGSAPDIEWIKAQYRKRVRETGAYSSPSKAAKKQNWKPPYPIVHTSWSQPEDPKKTP